jgi:hypothetical protein
LQSLHAAALLKSILEKKSLTHRALCCWVVAADAQHALEAWVELRDLVQLRGRVKRGPLHAVRNSVPVQRTARGAFTVRHD